MQGKAADCHVLLRMIRQIKLSSDRFRCVFVVSLYVTKVLSESVALSSIPVSPIYNFFAKTTVIL